MNLRAALLVGPVKVGSGEQGKRGRGEEGRRGGEERSGTYGIVRRNGWKRCVGDDVFAGRVE